MRKLAELIEGKGETAGFTYKKLVRDGDVAIYQASDTNYEVIVIGRQPASTRKFPDGRVINYEAQETYPHIGLWGTKGFTFNKYERALNRFNKLVEKQNAIQGN